MIDERVKILLVDDIEENLVALEALLRRDELEILRARSGPAALELLLVHEVALALVDVQMPEMDGFELAELMRGSERTKHVPIIFVTAADRDPRRAFKGYETGAVDFLYKPIDPRILKGKTDVFVELCRQRRELANALRLNEMFVGILGHDLRNPLGTILNGARALELHLEDEQQRQTIRRMTAAGQRMAAMIQQLLDLTRARLADGLGLVHATPEPLDVASLVERAVEEIRGDEPAKQLRLDVRGDCMASGDADRLLQLFSNLISNALQHGTPGSPVAIGVEGDGTAVAVRVHNHGVIPRDFLPRIFDPFQERPSTPGKAHGLGLGLFISRQIAAAHGGDISVESSEAAGTVFVARIPRISSAASS